MGNKRKIFGRRQVLGGAPVAALTVAGALSAGQLAMLGPVREVVWEAQACPGVGCGLPVCFLPGQRRNTCGHCGSLVVRDGMA